MYKRHENNLVLDLNKSSKKKAMERNLWIKASLVLLLLFACSYASPQERLEATTVAPAKSTTTFITEAVTDNNEALQEQIDELDSQVEKLTQEIEENEQQANATMEEFIEDLEKLENRVEKLEDSYDDVRDILESKSAQRTCQDYYDVGITSSDYYYIDPDGPNGEVQPMEVYCDMDSMPGYGITQFDHDSEDRTEVNGCEDPGCYQKTVVYNNTLDQMRSVVSLSLSCRQFIKYECISSMLFHYETESWWLSHDGVKQYYWGGAEPDSKMCACGTYGNCSNSSPSCNCDLNDKVWREDEGFLNDTSSLPVTGLAFGDTEAFDERGYHTLGKFECWGQGSGRTCTDLKKSGKPSGYYYINPDPANLESFQVYCDMEAYPGTGVTVFHHDEESRTQLDYYDGHDVYVTYDVDNMTQIESVIDLSEHCTQYISWQCYRTGFINYGTYWESRNGTQMTYWGGAIPNHDGYCGCGEDGTCYGGYNYNCNCDYVTTTTLIDAGELIDKNVLPVTKMHFYFYYSSSSYYGYYTLGPLKCY